MTPLSPPSTLPNSCSTAAPSAPPSVAERARTACRLEADARRRQPLPYRQGPPRLLHLVPQVLSLLQGARSERLGVVGAGQLRHLQLLQRAGPPSVRCVLYQSHHTATDRRQPGDRGRSRGDVAPTGQHGARLGIQQTAQQEQQLPELATTNSNPSARPYAGHPSARVRWPTGTDHRLVRR